MGRAADNERLKLKATFFNNIGVSCAVIGVLVPYLRFMEISGEKLKLLLEGKFSQTDINATFAAAICMAFAFLAARALRHLSDNIAGQIRGD
ncbi:hypothetical protein [Methylobacterium sp. Leaf125]|uniref:hypothetical protein n=1 Tax=Methylobacterium sp. Leaf125 TaxID=1736265 RepID=UPI000A9E4935|nr:hypothetical protein [Methylobacterium sp. Leaf125]